MDNNELIEEIESSILYLLREIRHKRSKSAAAAIAVLLRELDTMLLRREKEERLFKENSELKAKVFKLEQMMQYSSKRTRKRFLSSLSSENYIGNQTTD